MIRTSLLTGFASLALFAAPAMAQNISDISNTAAGIGNTANQSALVMQKSKGSFAGPNVATVTNLAAGISDQPLNHEEVLEAGQAAGPRISALLAEITRRI